MRRALVDQMPALTRFTYGALNPLTVEQFTLREINTYLIAMHRAAQSNEGVI